MNNFGELLIWLALFALFVSFAGYLVLCRKKKHKAARIVARTGFISFAALITIASIHFMLLILNHDFTYSYIVQYSSRDLKLAYLISSFWAGQEGSFLLWVLLGSWLGLLLMFRARNMEKHVMLVYNLNNIFLTILLIKQSPFKMLLVPPPHDGLGLNMLLQDPWMVIHPPVVFLGYAAFAVPFAYAITAMWKREYDAWIKPAMPWTLFAFVTLGAGIIIGGYWSYKVLGWGGYWAWDPVENASLLPWLLIIALTHGMILQYKRKKLHKTNLILAVFSFILVIYCTFLTRSGVLSDFSVHSFVDLGITGWLVFFMLAFLVISLVLFLLRLKDMPAPKGDNINLLSRESGLICAIVLLCISTILIGLGTSAPLITRLLEKASKVSMQYYVDTTLPLGILMAFFLSIVPLMTWGKNRLSKIMPGLISVIVCAFVSGIITFISGYHGIGILLFSLFAGAAACVNLFLAAKFIRKKITISGAAIAHLGVGLMFIGFVASSVYDRSDKALLKQGHAQNIMDYEFTFSAPEFLKEGKGFRLRMPLNVKKGESQFAALPDIYSEPGRNGQINRFIHPHIQRGLLADLYIAPINYDPGKKKAGFNKQILLKKGDTIHIQDYDLTFTGFEVSSMMGTPDGGDVTVGANILVSYKGGDPVNLKPVIIMGQTKSPAGSVKLPGPREAYIVLARIDATTKSISLIYHELLMDAAAKDAESSLPSILIDVSIKPGMTVLWTGVFLMLLGGSIATVRRY